MNIKASFAFVLASGCIIFIVSSLIESHLKKSAQQLAVINATTNAKEIAFQLKTLRNYYTKHVISKIKTTEALQIGVEHQQRSDMVPPPATMIHDLSHLIDRDLAAQFKLSSPFPFTNRGERELDAFQQKAWTTLSKDPKASYIETDLSAGQEHLRVGIADLMTHQSCVQCHNQHAQSPKKDWSIGDVRGVLEVKVPLNRVLSVSKASSEEMIQRVTSMLILMAFCFFVGFLLYQQLEAKRKRQFLTQARQHLERIQIASHNVAIVTDNVNQLSVITEKLSASCHESASKGMIVSDHIFTTRGNFDHLSTEALHINKMLKEINNIAQKTKLLALNATIEAASAGEAGQGFTIVAEEVQKLALRTSDSTSDITERLHRISSLIDNTSGQIDSIMSSTQDSEASTSSLSSDANRLSRTIQDVDTLVQEMHTKASSTSETIAQLQRDLERYFS